MYEEIILKPEGVPSLGCGNPACLHYNHYSSTLCIKCRKDRDWYQKSIKEFDNEKISRNTKK